MTGCSANTLGLLRLSLIPGLGPVLIWRLVEAFGSPEAALAAPGRDFRGVEGIGPERAKAIVNHRDATEEMARQELTRAEALGVHLLGRGDAGYPELLAQINDPPAVLYVRGNIDPIGVDRYCVAIVGSRRCTAYGIGQAERFAGAMASAGITVVSGGARGIDTAAHRAAIRCAGRTIAVLGCGLAHVYPEENGPVFDQIVNDHGAVLSELPLDTQPSAENFPARNRLISGLSLGTLVIEAGRGSGALITARLAAEDHGREVFAVPGRIDSTSSEGSNDLLKAGAAALVTCPADVIDALQSPARHLFAGTHEARYCGPEGKQVVGLTERQSAILAALTDEMTVDELVQATGVQPGELRADLTMLELQRRVVRKGTRIAAAGG